jgi:tetratricopeptide (TPR) repeat protein
MSGHLFSEGVEWLQKVLSRTTAPEPTALQAKAFRWLGRLTYLHGDDTEARSALDKSLALYRELGDKEGIADVLFSLGNIVGIQGDDDAARSFYAEARSFCEQSLAILRNEDDKWSMATSLNILGEMARVTDDYTAARSFYEESLNIRRTLGDQRGMAVSLHNLGFVANFQDDYGQAATFFERSLALFQKHGGIRGIVDCVAGLGGVAGGIKQPERAARLLGAAQALREALHFRLEYADRIEYDRDVATMREQLDEATFAAAWAEGQMMTLEQAVDYALATKANQS